MIESTYITSHLKKTLLPHWDQSGLENCLQRAPKKADEGEPLHAVFTVKSRRVLDLVKTADAELFSSCFSV
jgi:hypothetical protein